MEAVPVADVAVAGPAPEPQRNFFAFVDFALIAKLVIIVIIFNDGTTNRAAILSAFSLLFYL